jgi:hypothetical protein
MKLQSRIERDETIAPWEWWIQIMGRLKPNVARQQVLADVKDSFKRECPGSVGRAPRELSCATFPIP